MLPAGDKESNDALGDGADAAPKPVSMFKPRPHGDDDFDPLDLANALTDHEQEDLHPSALADQGDEESINPWRWFHPDGLTPEDVDRQDRAINAVQMGKPRTVFLPAGPVTYLRLTDPLTKDSISADGGEGAEHHQRARLKLEADTPVKLIGPATEHAIDEAISALFARAPAFGPFLQALRDSSHLSLMRGANYFHFRPCWSSRLRGWASPPLFACRLKPLGCRSSTLMARP
ncbi:hypothetical protein [Devosia aurantiaca]|uniref:Uncharacterized protein n=1 Tax=Devosia aurantiaca TaxID=2714858 RepID=A0A6M1SQF8_9HYPH|nr:hypothetical protein [Devosia aurantiaca]NGP18884.1 hypothetical protein [Devosia aurantiaca]